MEDRVIPEPQSIPPPPPAFQPKMSRTPYLPGMQPERRKRRVLARIDDMGDDEFGNPVVHAVCKRCGWQDWVRHESGWVTVPCPKCNKEEKKTK